LTENDYNDLNYYVSQYDGEIRYIDDQIKDLLTNMKDLGVLDNTIVFLTADHGGAFLEHGEWRHGSTLYDEMIHVPLIVKLPQGGTRGVRIDSPVHTFDISATVLDIVSIEPQINIQAKSLLPLINGDVENLWVYTFCEKPWQEEFEKWKVEIDIGS